MLANPTCWVAAARRSIAATIVLGLALVASTPVHAQNAVNSAAVSLPPTVSDPDTANNTATDSDGITRTSNLGLTKTDSPDPVPVGGLLTYTLAVSNAGPSAILPAATLSIVESLPAGLTGCSFTPSAGTFAVGTIASGATGTGIWSGISIASGGSQTLSIVCSVSASAAATLTNTATVLPPAGTSDPDCSGAPLACAGGNTAVATTTVNRPQLTITKTASAGSFTVGVPASYTLQLSNTGTAATTAVATITDTIPTGLTIGTLPASCTAAGQTVTCTVAAGLAAGSSTSFVIPVTPTAAAQPSVSNTASVSGGGDPGCPAAARCTSTAGPTPVNAPGLTITKTASAASFTVGVPASYTLQLSNTGTAATTAVATITDTIPTGLTIGTLPANCTSAGQTVTCTVAAGLAASASSSFVIPVTPTAAAQPSVTNTASVSGGGDPGCPAAARCTSSVGPTPVNGAQLTITKTASATSFTAGVPASYTLQLSNTGTAATTAVATITDTIPTGLTIGTLPAGCTSAGQTVTCTVAAGLAASASSSFVIPVTPTAAAQPSVTNTASVSGGGDPGCPAAARCTSTVGPTPVNGAQLTITKTASATSFTVGVPASYTLQLSNTGTASTTAVATITDTIPTGLTIGTLPANCTSAGQTVTCTVAAGLAASASSSFVIPVTPTAAAQPSVTNTASVSGGGDPGCPAAARCTSTAGPTPVNAPGLTITKSASAASFTVGVPASYTLQLSNTGTAATTAVATITDTIPTGLTIGTLPANCTSAGQTVTCTVAAGLAASASSSFVIPVTPTAAAQPSVTNTASVSGGGDPGCPAAARCTSTAGPTPVNAPGLTITKTASAASFTVGVPASYTLQLSNTGTAATTAVATITDTIPTGLTIGTLPANCTAAGQTVTCTVAAGLAASASSSFVIPVTPTAAAQPSVTNTATVTGGGDPGCPAAARCTSSVGPTPVLAPNVSLTKTANPASGSLVVIGNTLTYTLQATVVDAALTAPLQLTDTLGAGLLRGAVSAGAFTCNAGEPLVCSLPSGTAAGSYTLTYTATVQASATGTLGNSVAITGSGGDPTPACAPCTTSHPLAVADLQVVKSVDQMAPSVGQVIDFTLLVRNNGPDAATNVRVTDAVPTGYELLGTTASQGAYSAPLWTVGNMAAGQTQTLQMRVRVRPSGDYRNVAVVSGDQVDPTAANNTGDVTPRPLASLPPQAIPVNATWALWGLMLLMSGIAVRRLRRRG